MVDCVMEGRLCGCQLWCIGCFSALSVERQLGLAAQRTGRCICCNGPGFVFGRQRGRRGLSTNRLRRPNLSRYHELASVMLPQCRAVVQRTVAWLTLVAIFVLRGKRRCSPVLPRSPTSSWPPLWMRGASGRWPKRYKEIGGPI